MTLSKYALTWIAAGLAFIAGYTLFKFAQYNERTGKVDHKQNRKIKSSNNEREFHAYIRMQKNIANVFFLLSLVLAMWA